jgi:hypothetical protein
MNDEWNTETRWLAQAEELCARTEPVAVRWWNILDVSDHMLGFSQSMGALVAAGAITVDEAYAWCKIEAQHAATMSVPPFHEVAWVSRLLPSFFWWVDHANERVQHFLAVADAQAFRRLRDVARPMIIAHHPMSGVRDAMATVAGEIDPQPPVEILHDALHAAVAEVRSNERWMSKRANPQ